MMAQLAGWLADRLAESIDQLPHMIALLLSAAASTYIPAPYIYNSIRFYQQSYNVSFSALQTLVPTRYALLSTWPRDYVYGDGMICIVWDGLSIYERRLFY